MGTDFRCEFVWAARRSSPRNSRDVCADLQQFSGNFTTVRTTYNLSFVTGYCCFVTRSFGECTRAGDGTPAQREPLAPEPSPMDDDQTLFRDSPMRSFFRRYAVATSVTLLLSVSVSCLALAV